MLSLFKKHTNVRSSGRRGAEEDTHILAFGNDFTLFKDAQLCEAERGRGREMKDYLFLLGGRLRVSESQWEGGRQSETSKVIPERRTDAARAGASVAAPLL